MTWIRAGLLFPEVEIDGGSDGGKGWGRMNRLWVLCKMLLGTALVFSQELGCQARPAWPQSPLPLPQHALQGRHIGDLKTAMTSVEYPG